MEPGMEVLTVTKSEVIKCGKRPLHRWKTNIYDLMEKLSAFPQPANTVSHSAAPLTVYTHSHSAYYCY